MTPEQEHLNLAVTQLTNLVAKLADSLGKPHRRDIDNIRGHLAIARGEPAPVEEVPELPEEPKAVTVVDAPHPGNHVPGVDHVHGDAP